MITSKRKVLDELKGLSLLMLVNKLLKGQLFDYFLHLLSKN